MKLYLIRHAQSEENAKGVMHRRNDPSPLSASGRTQAEQVGRRIRLEGIEKVYASSEKRAVETARIATRVAGLEYEVLSGLRERDWGEWTDRPWVEIGAFLDTLSTDQRYDFIPPGGESWHEMDRRLTNAFEQILRVPYASVAIVTHSGAMRALIPILTGAPKEKSFEYDFESASFNLIECTGDIGSCSLKYTNDTSHPKDATAS